MSEPKQQEWKVRHCRRVGAEDYHYNGYLMSAARILEFVSDAAGELMIRHDGEGGLLAAVALMETRAANLLAGVRGFPKANRSAVVDLLERVAQLGLRYPEIGAIDLNPVLVGAEGAWVADARILVAGT